MDLQGGSQRTGVQNVATWKVVNRQLVQNARKLMTAHKLPVDIPQAKELLIFKVGMKAATTRCLQACPSATHGWQHA